MIERSVTRAVINRIGGKFAYLVENDGEVTHSESGKLLQAAVDEVMTIGQALPGRLDRVVITFHSKPPTP